MPEAEGQVRGAEQADAVAMANHPTDNLRMLEMAQASHWLMTDCNADCLQALQQHLERNQA